MTAHDVIARYYDLEHDPLTSDTTMYAEFQRREGGRVLIAGVGTGRVAAELAPLGGSIWGIDNSAAMLAVAREKLGRFATVRLLNADMTAFDIDTRFDMVVVPLDAFGLLASMEARRRALGCFRRHMHPDGLLLIDLVNPYTLPKPSQEGMLIVRFQVMRDSRMITAYDSVRLDHAAQTMDMRITYDVADDASIRREVADLCVHWLYAPEIQLLLELSGLEVQHVYGDYDLSLYETSSPRIIVAARLIGTTQL